MSRVSITNPIPAVVEVLVSLAEKNGYSIGPSVTVQGRNTHLVLNNNNMTLYGWSYPPSCDELSLEEFVEAIVDKKFSINGYDVEFLEDKEIVKAGCVEVNYDVIISIQNFINDGGFNTENGEPITVNFGDGVVEVNGEEIFFSDVKKVYDRVVR